MSALVFTWYSFVHFLVFWCLPTHESICPTTEHFIQLLKMCPVPRDAELLTKLLLHVHKAVFFLEQSGLMLSNKYWSCSLGVTGFLLVYATVVNMRQKKLTPRERLMSETMILEKFHFSK